MGMRATRRDMLTNWFDSPDKETLNIRPLRGACSRCLFLSGPHTFLASVVARRLRELAGQIEINEWREITRRDRARTHEKNPDAYIPYMHIIHIYIYVSPNSRDRWAACPNFSAEIDKLQRRYLIEGNLFCKIIISYKITEANFIIIGFPLTSFCFHHETKPISEIKNLDDTTSKLLILMVRFLLIHTSQSIRSDIYYVFFIAHSHWLTKTNLCNIRMLFLLTLLFCGDFNIFLSFLM